MVVNKMFHCKDLSFIISNVIFLLSFAGEMDCCVCVMCYCNEPMYLPLDAMGSN